MRPIGSSRTDQPGTGQRVGGHANPAGPGGCPAVAIAAWPHHRREAVRLDRTAGATMARRTATPVRAVTRTGQITGRSLSGQAVMRLIKPHRPGFGGTM